MPIESLKSRFSKFLISLGNSLKSSQEKKQIAPQTFQEEMKEFLDCTGIDIHNPNLDLEQFKSALKQYLESKNYDCEKLDFNVQRMGLDETGEGHQELKLPSRIEKISEDLNTCLIGVEVFEDTTAMTPGLICYTITKIAATSKKPYVTYKPDARVITQVHENGVNGGTIFLTYAHRAVKSAEFKGQKDITVVSEEEAVYTPLTKEQAIYVCKVLNTQSRIFYTQQIKRQQRIK